MGRDVFFGVFASNYGRGENGVGRSEACGNSKRRKKVEFGNQGIDEPSGNKPPLKKRAVRAGIKQERVVARTYVMMGKRRNIRLFQCLSM